MSEKKRKESLPDIENLRKKKHELEMKLANVEFKIKIGMIKTVKELFMKP